MYSMVLMAALTTGGSAPDCWFLGGGCHGCWGGGGCWGGWGHGYGGCYGGGWHGGTSWSCYGGCYGVHGCYGYGGGGCYGGPSYYSGCYGCYGGYGSPYAPGAMMMPATDRKDDKRDDKKTPDSSSLNRAKLVVELPADAKLFIDDQPTKTTSAQRVFSTPTLERGQSYYYIVRAEVVRDGKTYSESKRVIVRAGEEIRTAFPELETAALAAKAEASARR